MKCCKSSPGVPGEKQPQDSGPATPRPLSHVSEAYPNVSWSLFAQGPSDTFLMPSFQGMCLFIPWFPICPLRMPPPFLRLCPEVANRVHPLH